MQTTSEILKSMHDVLEPAGFSNSGEAFHRVAPTHFIEVVSFQAGLRGLAGKSAINLGIYIPEVRLLLGKCNSIDEARAYAAPPETKCTIRERLSTVVFGKDIWFDHNDPTVGYTISALLSSHGLPWFKRLGTLVAIAEEIKTGRAPLLAGWGSRAAILKAAGEPEAARRLLQGLQRVPEQLVEALAGRLGINLMPITGSNTGNLQEDDRQRLKNFFGGYFHEDWTEEADTYAGIVAAYLRDASQEEVSQTARSILRLLDCDYDDEALRQLLYPKLGCCVQLPTPDGMTAKEWLYDIVTILSPKPN